MVMLGDLVEITGGGTPSRKVPEYWNGNLPWATVKDFKELQLKTTIESITQEGLTNSASNLIPAGSIIIPTRMAVGKAAISSIDMAINQDLKALRIKDSNLVDRNYLFRSLLHKSDYLERRGKGATVKGITLDVLKELEIPLPPLEEQKRIAAILDKADAIRRKRQQTIDLADQFLRSVFLDMFGDPVTNPKDFPLGIIRDLVCEAKYGTSKKAHEKKGAYPILRMGNITYKGKWDLSNLKYVDLEEEEKPKYLAQQGDLLFNRTNSKELVGKSAVFEESLPMAIAGYLIRIRANCHGNNNYIAAYLNSNHGKLTLLNMCKSIVGMANINAQELQNIKILLPPIELQEKFGKVVIEARRKFIKQKRNHEKLDDLFSSLTQRAFKGELTKSEAA